MRIRTPTPKLRWPVAVVHFAQGAACAIFGLATALALALAGAPLPLVLGPPVISGLAAIASIGQGMRHLLIDFDPEDDD